MDVNKLDRATLLNQLKTFPKYQDVSKTKIGKGRYINDLRVELVNLRREVKQFDQFMDLPSDIQATILAEDPTTLKKSLRLTPSLFRSPAISNTYYHQFCNLPLSEKEITSYITNSLPINFLSHIFGPTFNNFHRLYRNDTIYNYQYIYNQIYLNNNRVLANSGQNFNNPITEIVRPFDNIDYINMYYVYKRRNCERVKPGYAKTKVLEQLNEFYRNIDFNNYQSLLFLFTFFKNHLKIANLESPKNIYKYYQINVNDDKATYGPNAYTKHDLQIMLSEDCEQMYNQLIQYINKLD